MSKQSKFMIVGITTIVAVGAVLYCNTRVKRRKAAFQRKAISDEGYETAFDILYPLKTRQIRRYKMRRV